MRQPRRIILVTASGCCAGQERRQAEVHSERREPLPRSPYPKQCPGQVAKTSDFLPTEQGRSLHRRPKVSKSGHATEGDDKGRLYEAVDRELRAVLCDVHGYMIAHLCAESNGLSKCSVLIRGGPQSPLLPHPTLPQQTGEGAWQSFSLAWESIKCSRGVKDKSWDACCPLDLFEPRAMARAFELGALGAWWRILTSDYGDIMMSR